MTDLTPPPMVPSAKERAQRAVDDYPVVHGEMPHAVSAAIPAIIDAHCDGFATGVQAERARIIAALREPSTKMEADVAVLLGIGTMMSAALLKRLADWLESQP